MKKLLTVAGVCAVGYLGTVYFVDRSDEELSERHLSQASFDKMDSLERSAFKIMTENGCRYCHTENSEMPFYADLPVAKQLMEQDVRMAQRQFNMESLLANMQSGQPVSAVDLTKIETVMEHQEMPPKLYLSMHWGSALSDEERATLVQWAQQARAAGQPEGVVDAQFLHEPVQPITTVFPTDPAKVALGEALYHDNRLSGDNTLSCASCHPLDKGGVSGHDVGIGIGGAKGPINDPTPYNAAFNTHQFWDGRAADLQEQAGGPPLNPIEMGSTSWEQIVGKLAADEEMVAAFNALYPQEGITSNSITDAIAEFEKTLVTPDSRFDLYLKGDASALDAKEQAGYALFKEYRCATCHVGEAMGGQSFELMGVKQDYFADRGDEITEVDLGRFNVTHDENDRYRFKTPTLRNVELTAPYFHDARAKTLEAAVDMMAKYQSGVELTSDEISKITAFLKTLTGTYRGKPLSEYRYEPVPLVEKAEPAPAVESEEG